MMNTWNRILYANQTALKKKKKNALSKNAEGCSHWVLKTFLSAEVVTGP